MTEPKTPEFNSEETILTQQKLIATLKATHGLKFVKKKDNQEKLEAIAKIAQEKLEALRSKNFFDIDSEDRYPDRCRCCRGAGEHNTGRECYGCDASGLDSDFEGEVPCAGATAYENSKAINANITEDQQRQIDLATEQFKQSVNRVDNQILALYVQAIQNGDYAEAERILEKAQAQELPQVNTLMFALLTIGTILLPLYAAQRIRALFVKFGLGTIFAQTEESQRALKDQAQKGAESHVITIARDIKNALDESINEELTTPAIEANIKDKYEKLAPLDGDKFVEAVKDDEKIYKYARDLVLSGASKDVVIQKLQEKFSDVTKKRAAVIAGNEANRVFTLSQYEADAMFLAQNDLTDKAYKRLVSNTGTPCPVCKHLIDKTHNKPIPFKSDFATFGKAFSYDDNGKKKKFTPNYEHLRSGHIHVNCHCRYELIIKRDDGTFYNYTLDKVENAPDYDFTPDLHPRDKDGKFKTKPGLGLGVFKKVDVKKIATKETFDEYVKKSALEYTEAQARSAKLYQSPNFYTLNDGVRYKEKSVIVSGKNVSINKFQDIFDPTFDVEVKEEAVVYRGVPTFPDEFKVNQSYKNDGYTSVTTVEGTAREKFKTPSGSLIHLTIPAGTKVSIPDLVSRDIASANMDEQEIVLPVGAEYVVYEIQGDKVFATLL